MAFGIVSFGIKGRTHWRDFIWKGHPLPLTSQHEEGRSGAGRKEGPSTKGSCAQTVEDWREGGSSHSAPPDPGRRAFQEQKDRGDAEEVKRTREEWRKRTLRGPPFLLVDFIWSWPYFFPVPNGENAIRNRGKLSPLGSRESCVASSRLGLDCHHCSNVQRCGFGEVIGPRGSDLISGLVRW